VRGAAAQALPGYLLARRFASPRAGVVPGNLGACQVQTVWQLTDAVDSRPVAGFRSKPVGYNPRASTDRRPGMSPRCVCVQIPATANGPTIGRRFVAELLPLWGLAELSDAAVLVVSELVSNALRHAPGPASYPLRVQRHGPGVRLYVADSSTAAPAILEPDEGAAHGRGMRMIAALASAWGAEKRCAGKQVWVDVDRPL
jgi:hypothetical protein